MEITTGGRSLTMAGHKYLKNLDSKVKPWCRWWFRCGSRP
jgi:hypothetical protein